MSFSVSLAIGFEDKTDVRPGPPVHADVFTVFAVIRREPMHSGRPMRRAGGGLGGFGFARLGRRAARGEEGGARERAVEAGPALAVRERLLDAVEAAELAAEVV